MIDYIGFTFGAYHSSELGILRTSDGSRYEEDLTPPIKDVVLNIEGNDTSYFLESQYEPKIFTINIAFDGLTEEQISQLRCVFQGTTEQPLIFDERPYKAYYAKIQNPISLKYIPFDIKGERIYKGEGVINFIAYDPFATGVGKYLADFSTQDFPNRDEWATSSRMKMSQEDFNIPGLTIKTYNAGDIDTDLLLYYKISNMIDEELLIQVENHEEKQIKIMKITSLSDPNDYFIRFNSKTFLLEGCDINKQLTGSLYNHFILAGDFFKLSPGEHKIFSSINCEEIEYFYRYF